MNIIKKLPKIYQNDINKKIKNNKETFYSYYSNNKKENTINFMSTSDIELFLDGIFNGIKQVYNVPVIIQTNTKVYDTYLVLRTPKYLLTIDQDRIRIEDIILLKRKNP